jgi:low temperature requirement protein LtrA
VGGLERSEPAENFAADPVELFFDLAFVFAFSQLVGLLVGTPTWDTVGQATLIFLMLWLPWTQFAWSANAVPGNSRTVRVLFLVATAASVPMAAAVQTAFDQSGALFAIPLAVISLMGIALMVIGLPDHGRPYRSALRYATPTLLAMAAFVVGGFLVGDARVVAWILGVVIMKPTIRAGGRDWIIRPFHFAERHALIIIVALGEVIVAIGNSVVNPLGHDGDFPAQTVVELVAAGAFAGLLWWAYFDRLQPAFEHRTEETAPAKRWKFARDIYTYAHAPIVAGVILSAVALEEMVLYPSDPLPAAYRAMGAAGIALYFGGMGFGVYRSFGVVTRERFIAVALIIVVMLVGYDISGVILLVAIDLILLATLILEHRRIGDTPSELGDPSAPSPSAHDVRGDGEAAK